MDTKRSYVSPPTMDDNKLPMFTPRGRSPPVIPSGSCGDSNSSIYALQLSPIKEVQTSHNSVSLDEQLRLERDIAHRSSIITRDSFATTYSSLQTMLSQMQLKVAAAFLEETEYLQQREQRLEQDELMLKKRKEELEIVRNERKRMEEEFVKVKDRLEAAVIEVTKFKTDGAEMLRMLFAESRQIDEQLSQLISDSMASLIRSRIMIQTATNQFVQKSDNIRSELIDRAELIRNTQSSITLMLDLVNAVNELNAAHGQDLAIVKMGVEQKYNEFIDMSHNTKHDWDIAKELDEIRLLENEKLQAEKDLLEQATLLENIKVVLGKTTS